MAQVQPRILVVDDEEDILELVAFHLRKEGCEVSTAVSGEEALESADDSPPDLVVLDLMLPMLDGLSVCRRLKKDDRTRGAIILMLSAKGEEADIVAGLEIGADDYVTKPFSPKVLVARVKALLRRQKDAEPSPEGVLRIKAISIDPARHKVVVDGIPVELTKSEFLLLDMLARRPGRVFTRTQIVDRVRGEGYPVTERSVDVHVVGLRRKLGTHGDVIETVRGVGYRFSE
ncbi:MAG: response regulator [Planctomycetota bacterium]